MCYDKSIVSALSNIKKLSYEQTIEDANKNIRKIKGMGLVWAFKKILCIFPRYRAQQHQKISHVYKKCFFEIEVVRDKKKLNNITNTLNPTQGKEMTSLMEKVNKLISKKEYAHLKPYLVEFESTILKQSKKVNSKVSVKDFSRWAKDLEMSLLREPVKTYLTYPKFGSHKYFNSLRSMTGSDRRQKWDEVSSLDIGISTQYLKEEILPTLKDADREVIGKLIAERETKYVSNINWKKAVDELETEYWKKKASLNEAKEFSEKAWKTIEEKYPNYLPLLDDKNYAKEFKEWVFRDKLDIGVFFESRACVELMKDFTLPEHLSTCGDKIGIEENRVPSFLVDGETKKVPWISLAWDKIFIGNEYIREDFKYIDKEIGSLVDRNLYYMPKRGLTEHNPIKNKYLDIENIPAFSRETVTLKGDAEPCADITPIISYQESGPSVEGTHVYIQLRIPKGEVFFDNGERKIAMDVYPVGIARDSRVRESKKKSLIYKITNIVLKSLKRENVILAFPDQNELYRNRKFDKLNKPINLTPEQFTKIKGLFAEYQESYENGVKTGEFKKAFQIVNSNCTNLIQDIYTSIDMQPLPRKLPIYHLLNPKIAKKFFRFDHKKMPKLGRVGLKLFSKALGARGDDVQKNLFGNTTWLQRATIGLINENQRFNEMKAVA